MFNPFFKNHGPLTISEIIQSLNINMDITHQDKEIHDIKDLLSSKENDITFFHSKKYKDVAKKTKASFCLTTKGLINELPKSCIALLVDNFGYDKNKVSKLFAEVIPDEERTQQEIP